MESGVESSWIEGGAVEAAPDPGAARTARFRGCGPPGDSACSARGLAAFAFRQWGQIYHLSEVSCKQRCLLGQVDEAGIAPFRRLMAYLHRGLAALPLQLVRHETNPVAVATTARPGAGPGPRRCKTDRGGRHSSHRPQAGRRGVRPQTPARRPGSLIR